MIGSDPNLRPKSALSLKAPVSAFAGLTPPRTIADATTESAANNAIASGYQKGNARAAMGSMDRAGFSRGANERMRAGQAEAAGIAAGAAEAGGIRADDQSFNEGQNAQYQQLLDQRMNDNFGLQTGMNSANFSFRNAAQQNAWNLRMARQRASNSLRLALLNMMG
jgi:hypothetical protein